MMQVIKRRRLQQEQRNVLEEGKFDFLYSSVHSTLYLSQKRQVISQVMQSHVSQGLEL